MASTKPMDDKCVVKCSIRSVAHVGLSCSLVLSLQHPLSARLSLMLCQRLLWELGFRRLATQTGVFGRCAQAVAAVTRRYGRDMLILVVGLFG